MIKNKTILAIGAHPDDIEYWAGGTMLKLAKENKLIFVIVTNGEINGEVDERKREQRKTAKLIGVKKLIFLNYPDSELEINRLALQRDLLRIILRKRPEVVFSFDPENQFSFQQDAHPDHRVLSLIVADLVMIFSTLPAYIKKSNLNLKALKTKPELWLFNPKNPNHFEDIAEVQIKKGKLLKSFRSQKLSHQDYQVEAFHRINFYCKIKRQ